MNQDIYNAVKEAGVVGAGGAGFPTYVKVGSKGRIVIANGAECEPLLQNDKFLMEFETDKILSGIALVMNSTGAEKGYFAVKKKNKNAVVAIQKAIPEFNKKNNVNIEIFLLDNFYPAGDEHTLVNEVTGMVVPEGGIPPQIGVIVDNVETLINIHNAYHNKKPVVDRNLTVTGEVFKPKVFRAPIGTSYQELIDYCGGTKLSDFVIIDGGPMMGSATTDLTKRVTKTSGGLIVLDVNNPLARRKTMPIRVDLLRARASCCQCQYCSDLCPRNQLGHELWPHMIMRSINYSLPSPSKTVLNAMLCCECGVCEAFACKMNLSPRVIYQMVKKELRSNNIRPNFDGHAVKSRPTKDYRKVPTNRLMELLGISKYYFDIKDTGTYLKTNMVKISLRQHIGAPSIPIVKINDSVKIGTIIAKQPDDALGANIHSSIDGKVTDISNDFITIKA